MLSNKRPNSKSYLSLKQSYVLGSFNNYVKLEGKRGGVMPGVIVGENV